MADIVTDAPVVPGGTSAGAASEASKYQSANDMLMNRMPSMVKGAGMAMPGGNELLKDPKEIFSRSWDATYALKSAVKKGITDPAGVVKGFSSGFNEQFGMFQAAMGAPAVNPMAAVQQLVGQLNSELGKNFDVGYPASGTPVTTGLVPVDLVAPSRLIYPVYSPLRNKIPRVPGQGSARRAKVITGVSGSHTGTGTTGNFLDISFAETVPSTSGAFPNGGSSIPQSGNQSGTDITVPYKFFGLTESLSWLAQFAGQGFEDISALANLILLQEFMMNEEAAIIGGTTTNITAPTTAVSATARTPGIGEVAIPTQAHYTIYVTAANFFGETVVNTGSTDYGTSGAGNLVTGANVLDVLLPQTLPPGALWWNVYVSVNASPATANEWLQIGNLGGSRITLQGTTLVAGSNPPAADSGTGGSNRISGIIPTLTGKAASEGVYPAGWQAGFYQPSVGTHLSISAVNRMLQGLWDGDAQYGNATLGAYRADPAELIGEGSDILNLSNDIVQTGTATNYRLMIDQPELSGLRAGAAVSEFQNPITRSVMKLLVHPWWPQGTAVAMSYTLPFSWSNVSNCWEMTLVQDYISVAWPVIDPTFRYSMFMYGGLVAQAPQYSGIMQGLQRSDVTPYA